MTTKKTKRYRKRPCRGNRIKMNSKKIYIWLPWLPRWEVLQIFHLSLLILSFFNNMRCIENLQNRGVRGRNSPVLQNISEFYTPPLRFEICIFTYILVQISTQTAGIFYNISASFSPVHIHLCLGCQEFYILGTGRAPSAKKTDLWARPSRADRYGPIR